MDIAQSFSSGDELEVNAWTQVIRLNGTVSPLGLGDGGSGGAEMVLLRPSTNELQVGSDDESINITINTEFRKTYLY